MLISIAELVRIHIARQLDVQTTRLLFAASRGDTATIATMCGAEGFDPDQADYDQRTALMVAAMKGNTDVVRLLVECYGADPNKVDVHGTTALLEAVKNGKSETMALLLKEGSSLSNTMPESVAASLLCQTIYDGDLPLLRRLLEAGIKVNATDYHQRTAAHVAAAEGNRAAIRLLLEFGADFPVEEGMVEAFRDLKKREKSKSL
eukprot:scaffold10056_cov164-Amphora_coffeaeformis.AAC.4